MGIDYCWTNNRLRIHLNLGGLQEFDSRVSNIKVKGLFNFFATVKIPRFSGFFSKGERGEPGRDGEDGPTGIKVGDNGHVWVNI